jgi:hypothetical protein
VLAKLVSESVITEPPDQIDLRPQSRCRDRLIRPFAPGDFDQLAAMDRLPRPGDRGTPHHPIRVDRADDDDSSMAFGSLVGHVQRPATAAGG